VNELDINLHDTQVLWHGIFCCFQHGSPLVSAGRTIAAMPQSWSQQQISAGILRVYQIHQEATTTMMLTMAIIK